MTDGKFVILYVDDDQDMLDSLRIILEANGYAMVEALSAEDGLRKYKEHHPDFIIVDLMMEEMDSGLALVKELRAVGNAKPVYMLSSVGDQLDQTVSPEQLGLTGVFQKPVESKTLLTTLKEKLRK
jgi:DNA-binding response OmpR family regulator